MRRLLGLQLSLPRPPPSRRGKLVAVALSTLTLGVAGSVFHAEGANTRMTADGGVRAAHARAVAAARAEATLRSGATSRSGRELPGGRSSPRQRTADTSHAGALFAAHSWYVAPPPPPPVAPPPPPPPAAPPFPYAFVGSYAPVGAKPVYFLSRADRVIDAHVGDRLDGVYEFESAGSGSLVFNYLPLNIRQSVPIGVSQ